MAQLGKKEVGRQPSTQPGEAAQDREARQAGDGGARGAPRPGNKEADDGCHGDEEEEEEEEGRGLRGKGERGDKGGERGQETREHGCQETEQEVQESCFISHPNNLGEVRVHLCVCVCSVNLGVISQLQDCPCRQGDACMSTNGEKLVDFAFDGHVRTAVKKITFRPNWALRTITV